jgi:hypothetical protein
MKIKYLFVTFTDRRTYKIPAEIIARTRAYYYACNVDGFDTNSEEYKKEYEYSLSDNSELIDWAYNNINWEDIKEFAEEVTIPPSVDYDKGWSNADMQIEEIEE